MTVLKRTAESKFVVDLVCRNEAHEVRHSDFNYYDKDGFELTVAERKFYQDNRFPLNQCLNHWAFQLPWLEFSTKLTQGLHLDHCLLLHRCEFQDQALEQIQQYIHPNAAFMAQTRPKWGIDFAIDHLDDRGDAVEILHIELDDCDFNKINDRKLELESWLVRQDWLDCARRVRQHRDEWANLQGFAQNDWKAGFLMGWTRAEYTEKSVNFAK